MNVEYKQGVDILQYKNAFIKQKILDRLERFRDENDFDNIISSLKELIQETESEFNIDLPSEHIIDRDFIGEQIEYLNNIKVYKTSDTFKALSDKKIIRNGLMTVGAESSNGKTAFVSHLVLDILQNNSDTIVAFYTLDDSIALVLQKMLTSMFNSHGLKTDCESVLDIYGENFESNIFNIFDDGRIAIYDNLEISNLKNEILLFKNYINRNKRSYKNVVIVIDYLQIIKSKHFLQSSNIRENLNTICADLKAIQKELNCLMILTSQFNRDSKSSSPRYRETSEIENISDVLINLKKHKEFVEDFDISRAGYFRKNKKYEAGYNTSIEVFKDKLGNNNMWYKTNIDETFLLKPLVEKDKTYVARRGRKVDGFYFDENIYRPNKQHKVLGRD